MGFKVEKQTVIMAATWAKNYVESVRTEEFEKEITRLLTKRFFKCKTRKQAEEKISRYDPVDLPWLYRYEDELQNAKYFLLSCSITVGDWIELSKDDAATVARWMKGAANS